MTACSKTASIDKQSSSAADGPTMSQNGFRPVRLTGQANYATWKKHIETVLVVGECIEAIETPEAATAVQQRKAKALLTQLIDPTLYFLVLDDDTAKTLYDRIVEKYGQTNKLLNVGLKGELQEAKMTSKESVDDYYSRLQQMRSTLANAGIPIGDDLIEERLIVGVPPSYRAGLAPILNRDVHTLAEVLSSIRMSEALAKSNLGESNHQRNGKHVSGAFNVTGDDDQSDSELAGANFSGARGSQHRRPFPRYPRTIRCYTCMELGHLAKDCPFRQAIDSLIQTKTKKAVGGSAVALSTAGAANDTPALTESRPSNSSRRRVSFQTAGNTNQLFQSQFAALEEEPLPVNRAAAFATTSYNTMRSEDEPSDNPSQANSATFNRAAFDRQDYQLEQDLFADIDRQYGPFDLDAAADPEGQNSFCQDFCSKQDSFLDRDVSGMNVWMNPPFNNMQAFLEHYLACKSRSPSNTSACIVVPVNPKAEWWPLLSQMTQIRVWKEGTQLFTLPGWKVGQPRRIMRPCHFPVAVFHDPCLPAASAKVSNASSRDHSPCSGPFILDSGATHHVTGNRSLLQDFTVDLRGVPTQVEVADSRVLQVKGTGKISISSTVDNQQVPVELHNVLYVPEFKQTLVSLTQILDKGADVQMKNNKCTISTPQQGNVLFAHRNTVIYPKVHPNLFTLSGILVNRTASAAQAAAAQTQDTQAELWHKRMGHLGYHSLGKLINMTNGVNCTQTAISEQPGLCEGCMMGRQAREPRHTRQTTSTVPLYRLHADVCGPLPVTSLTGKRYFLVVVDEATRFSAVQTLASKDEAAEGLTAIVAQLERMVGRSVQRIRTDRGGEFMAHELRDHWRALGVIHEPTAAYSPESNGRAERCNRTLCEKARSMLHSAGLPGSFWDEAVVYASTLRNLSPAHGISKTPWEMLTGQKPNLSFLRVFGSLAFVHVPDVNRNKLDPKCVKGVVLGSMPGNMYRVWINGSVKVVRDIKIDESVQGWTSLGNEPDSTSDDCFVIPSQQYDSEDSVDSEDSEEDNDRYWQSVVSRHHLQQPVGDPTPGEQDGPALAPEPVPEVPLRRSTRVTRPPSNWWGSAVGNSVETAVQVTWKDPSTVEEAMQSDQWPQWQQAMQCEYDALVSNGTWELVKTPPGVRPLPAKWVFKTKTRADGSIERFKGRLVVGGHRQQKGVDYNEVYSPVGMYETFRVLMAKVAMEDLELHSVDISNAFLNGVLKEEVYMQQPKLFTNGRSDYCCRLRKTLYGLHQAPAEWYRAFTQCLVELGFTAATSDEGLWILHGNSSTPEVLLFLWVDDLLLISSSKPRLEKVKGWILSKFKGRDLGPADRFLGISIDRDRGNRMLKLSQPTHIRELLERFNMQDCNGRRLPMDPGAILEGYSDGDIPMEEPGRYLECVGALLYLANTTRPDLSLAVGVLSRHSKQPAARHWEQVKGVLKYLAQTRTLGIVYGSSKAMHAYTDSDYAACKDTRKSRGGLVFTLGGGAVVWQSKLQGVVALSTAEAEYVASCAAVRKAVWLRRLYRELSLQLIGPMDINLDNQAANYIANNEGNSRRTKHIDVPYHYVRQMVAEKVVKMVHVGSADNVADVFTKPLPLVSFIKFRDAMGMQ